MKNISRLILFLFPVFFLLSFKLFYKQNQNEERQQSKNTKLFFPSFQITIFNYKVYNTELNEEQTTFEYISPYSGAVNTTEIEFHKTNENEITFFVKKDTIHLAGIPDEYIGNKLLQILPKNKNDRFKITLWIEESISEQFDPRKFIKDDQLSTDEYKQLINTWEANKVSWKGITKYRQMKDSLNFFFRMPIVGEDAFKNLRKKIPVRDTLVDLSGESNNIATVVYKNKPCYYGISQSFILIERFTKRGLIETKYVFFSDTNGE